MGEKHVETERKYEGTGLPGRLDSVPGVATAERLAEKTLDAVYYDAPDLRLLHQRITLRRRTGGDDAGWHLKLPCAGDSRREVRLPLAAGGARSVPAELAARVAAFARGATLLPVAHLRTHRSGLLLRDDGGTALAEVTEDRVTAQVVGRAAVAPGGPDGRPSNPEGGPGGTSAGTSGWTEFEIELVNGAPKLLDRIDKVFTRAGVARSAWPSKLARALGATETATGTAAPDTSDDGMSTAGAAVMAAYRSLVDELLVLDGAVRCGEADSVHRMRVVARRLRSLLRAHHRLFDCRQSDSPAAELRWLGRLLGEARDQEVLAAQLVAGLDAVPAHLRQGALRGRITERYAHGYRLAWRRAVRELDGPRYFALLDRLDALAADPPLRDRAGAAATGYLEGVLRREQRRTVKRLDRALRTAPGPRRDRALHRGRKAAKRARYTAEASLPALSNGARRRTAKFGARMKKLHKALGVHQDSVVTRRALVALATEGDGAVGAGGATPAPDRARADAFAYGILHQRQGEAAENAVRRLPKLRKRAARKKLTKRS